jgi:iron complex transport system substrate-binding protein
METFIHRNGGTVVKNVINRPSGTRAKREALLPFFLLLLLVIAVTIPQPASASNPSASPGRIVSLSPAITEALYLLGMKNAIVGVTIYCRKPPEAREKPKVGSVIEADVEKIVSLKPDLILAMSLTSERNITQLRNLGLKVVTLEIPRDYRQLCEVLLRLGKTVGKEDMAFAFLSESRKRVSDIQNRVKDLPKPKVLVQIGSKPFFVATRDYFVNDYVEFAGGINIFRDARSGAVGREEAVRRNPGVIIIAGMGISGENERNTWKRFVSIEAVKKNSIHVIDPDVCSPTPVSFAESLEEISHMLHP